MYVAALLAASEMAAALGETGAAGQDREDGRAPAPPIINDELFNGRWFIQKIDLGDKAVLAPFDTGRKAGVLADGFMETYWSDEFGELKYQMGEGCISDQILGQWHAEVAGIGGFLDEDKVETALKAVHDNNFRCRPAGPLQPLPQLCLRGRRRPARRHLPRRASASRWSPPPMPRRSGPASSICPPRT